MALPSIPLIVRNLVPWLAEADLPAIQAALDYQFIALQPYTKKTDEEVDVEENYTKLQRLLLADLTAYQLVFKRAAETAGGKDGVATNDRVLKRAKADVVETEFETVKASDRGGVQLDTKTLLAELKQSACGHARALGYQLPLCGAGATTEQIDVVPFITLTDCGPAPFNPFHGCC